MPRQSGFTLVEILVAISVAVLLVSLVYGMVRIGQRSAAAVDSQVEQTEIMRIGWEFLHAALSRASAVPNPEDRQDPTSFSGGAKFLSFVADMPSYIGMGGLMRISLDIDETTDPARLIVSRQRFDRRGDATPENASDSAVLVDDLETLEISYYGRPEAGEPPAWLPEWREQPALPTLIRVAIKPADAPAWPRLSVGPLVGSAGLAADAPPGDGEPAEPEAADGEPVDGEAQDGDSPDGQTAPGAGPAGQDPT